MTYIEPDQLSLPEQYTDVGKFPDKFLVDGFILCVDVSLDFEKPGNPQREIFDKLLHNIISTKKPVVVACTKFDRALDHSVAAVNDMVLKAKRQVPVIEVSALKGVNVDLCFLVLSHLVDTKIRGHALHPTRTLSNTLTIESKRMKSRFSTFWTTSWQIFP